MGIYNFTCKACHNLIREKKAQGEEVNADLLCQACRTEAGLEEVAGEAEASEEGRKARKR